MAHSLKSKNGGRRSIQLNRVFPIINNLKGQLQVSKGYGETSMDYITGNQPLTSAFHWLNGNLKTATFATIQVTACLSQPLTFLHLQKS